MDKGFQQWFAKTVITRIKSQETALLKEERAAQIIKEEHIRTRCRRCGWTAVSWFITMASITAGILGVLCACIVFAAALGMIFGISAFIGCTWNLPNDQCLLFEVRNTTHVVWSNEDIWKNVEYIMKWQKSVAIAMDTIFEETRFPPMWKLVQTRVCSMVAEEKVYTWESIVGIYKLP
jgi:hypothetical protein